MILFVFWCADLRPFECFGVGSYQLGMELVFTMSFFSSRVFIFAVFMYLRVEDGVIVACADHVFFTLLFELLFLEFSSLNFLTRTLFLFESGRLDSTPQEGIVVGGNSFKN